MTEEILFWAAYLLGTYKINEIVEGWPNHIGYVGLGFLTVGIWFGMCALMYAAMTGVTAP